jgi:hypothetical protein
LRHILDCWVAHHHCDYVLVVDRHGWLMSVVGDSQASQLRSVTSEFEGLADIREDRRRTGWEPPSDALTATRWYRTF